MILYRLFNQTTILSFIYLFCGASLHAAEYESVLGFTYKAPDHWMVLSRGNLSQEGIDDAIEVFGKTKGGKLVDDVRAGKKEYLYGRGEMNSSVNDISIQLTQGELLPPLENDIDKCAAIKVRLIEFYQGKFKLERCKVNRSTILKTIESAYQLTDKHISVRQYEFQLTPRIVLVLSSNSQVSSTGEVGNIQESIAKAIRSFFAEYPRLHQKAVTDYSAGNFEAAYDAFVKLADLGDIEAEYNLAVMYELGQGLEQNYQNAFEYFNRAAGKGNILAISGMARLLYHGRGVEQDFFRAQALYKLAAESGLGSAQNTYGAMLLLGKGTEPNPKEAMLWFTKALKQGNSEAAINLEGLYKEGTDAGNPDATHALALLYLNGLTGKQHVEKGLRLLRKAAASSHWASIESLYQIYSGGHYGIEPDLLEADKWAKWRQEE
jgi:TPR repeat protein